MANGGIGQSGIKALSDQSLVAFAESQRNKIESFAIECGSHGARDGIDHSLQVF
jgi:hypothetical protein